MSATTLYTGLDLHKRSVFALTVDAAGEEVAREKLPARADSLVLYFADLPGSRGAKHRAVAEATTGWYWVKDVARVARRRLPTRPREGRQGHHRGEGEDRRQRCA